MTDEEMHIASSITDNVLERGLHGLYDYNKVTLGAHFEGKVYIPGDPYTTVDADEEIPGFSNYDVLLRRETDNAIFEVKVEITVHKVDLENLPGTRYLVDAGFGFVITDRENWNFFRNLARLPYDDEYKEYTGEDGLVCFKGNGITGKTARE